MKKLLMAAAVVACSASIVSAEVLSSNIVGYSKVTKTANAQLNMVGVSFVSTSQALNELFPPEQFQGDAFEPGLCDQIIVWNAGTQTYETYVYWDIASYYGSAYAYLNGWQTFANFGTENYANPVLPAGSAFWFKGSGGSPSTFLAMGEVKQDATVSQPIVAGLQQLANPFATANTLGGLFGSQASGDAFEPGLCDQIIVWSEGTQSYETYVYWDIASYYGSAYAYLNGWQTFANFGTENYADNVVIPLGKGFWYKATAPFTWDANKNF